ncbi:MAG TPA: ferredoxin [Phycisphaerae bacterium]|nr:ferredoxin [Phycisphaerae bacterium]HOB74385.1 ferredoxin [Phycisphaerae bacterium]HOJ54496.1 ferredoxin [Phycisphaerae bacterium]HOL26525.1 ferredoxin [Phycisphaerae bacterium]HPP20924.1 ferredoxin [Phycisphaerae bacterium]
MAVTKVEIEAGECISCEACVAECDAVFEMGDDAAVVKAEAQNPEFLAAHTDGIKAAVEACPSSAIKVEEA